MLMSWLPPWARAAHPHWKIWETSQISTQGVHPPREGQEASSSHLLLVAQTFQCFWPPHVGARHTPLARERLTQRVTGCSKAAAVCLKTVMLRGHRKNTDHTAMLQYNILRDSEMNTPVLVDLSSGRGEADSEIGGQEES